MMSSTAFGLILMCLPTQEPSDPKIPEELQKVFDGLIRAFEAANDQQIYSFALEGAVTVTAQERKENPEYGTYINLPFLKKGFDKKIFRAIEGTDGTYLIRTGSSYLRFVFYRNAWKLYRYGDKPIE